MWRRSRAGRILAPGDRGFARERTVTVHRMSHVVMQAAEFATLEAATAAEAALQQLFAAYVAFEDTAAEPWSAETVPTPLVELGKRYGVAWPGDDSSRFLLKGGFDEAAEVLRVDRIVLFFGGGFDLGGEWLRAVLRKLGAVQCTEYPWLVA